MRKIVEKTDSLNAYKRLADEKADSGDLLGALGLYLTVLKCNGKDINAVADVADCYADMGLLELSNRYWFLYLVYAPKDKQGVAFEELAINYFYLDNLWASGYYFHRKMDCDGFVAEEGLDEEIIKFFSSAAVKKDDYFIAYPYDIADYSGVAKKAKRAFAAGDIAFALREYGKIPEECRTEEISGDYATALFLDNQDDEVLKVCKDSLSRHGENVNAYCNLSSLHHARGDEDKAKYYYDCALKSRKGDKYEDYKIATCAIERGDHLTAKRCISVILDERPYDDVMNFFYALALMNLGEREEGLNAISKALKIHPDDPVYEYYYSLFAKICGGDMATDGFIPFKYAKALPRNTEAAYKRAINRILDGKSANGLRLTDEQRTILKTALVFEDRKTAKSAAFLLGSVAGEKEKDIIYSALLNEEVEDEVKNSLVYLLIAGGEKKRINVVVGNYFASVKPRKVVFENKEDGAPYMSAYALAVTKMLAWGVDDCAKIAFNMNVLYTDFAELIRFNGFGAEVLATLCYLMCGFGGNVKVKNACAAFGVDNTLVNSVSEFYEFVKNTEPIKIRERAAQRNKKRKKENDRD